MYQRHVLSAAALSLVLGLSACGGGSNAPAAVTAPSPVAVGDTLVVTASGQLSSFNRAAPGTQIGSIAITGMGAGETVLGMDIRSADDQLYVLSSAGKVYTVVPSTGVATLKSTLKADGTGTGTDGFLMLAGDQFAVDFNPAADRLRVISNTGQNLRINVDTGAASVDGVITQSGSAATITEAAYTNAFAGTVSTRLYDLDIAKGELVEQTTPNSGTLAAPGVSLLGSGVTVSEARGFDIDARTNTGFAVLKVAGETALYSVNLAATSAAPAATKIAALTTGSQVVGMALIQPQAPVVFGLAAGNKLYKLNLATPNTIGAALTVSVPSGETLVGVDMRPANRTVYGVTNAAKLYTINTSTGVATFVASLSADPADLTSPFTGLDTSTRFSVYFNPVADRLRVISEQGQNLRIAVADVVVNGTVTVPAGAVTTDAAINRTSALPTVVAAAYTNSFPLSALPTGTMVHPGTMLYNIEANSSTLTLQNPPNNGTLTDVGALGVNVTGMGASAMDIVGGGNGLVLAALRAGTTGPFSLYSVNLTTGAATAYKFKSTLTTTPDPVIGGTNGPADLIDVLIQY